MLIAHFRTISVLVRALDRGGLKYPCTMVYHNDRGLGGYDNPWKYEVHLGAVPIEVFGASTPERAKERGERYFADLCTLIDAERNKPKVSLAAGQTVYFPDGYHSSGASRPWRAVEITHTIAQYAYGRDLQTQETVSCPIAGVSTEPC